MPCVLNVNKMRIGCVILAGGKSKRMKQDKAFLLYQGKSFIEQIKTQCHFFEEKILSRNDSLLKDDEWIIISDQYQEIGPMGGIYSVLKHCQSDALFVIACDTPYITTSLIQKICHQYQGEDILICRDDNGKIHPLCGIYHKRILPLLEKHIQKEHYRLMKMIEQTNYQIMTLNHEDSLQLQNINTPEDYQKIKTNFESR